MTHIIQIFWRSSSKLDVDGQGPACFVTIPDMKGDPAARTGAAIAKRLIALQEALGLNQREICAQAGIEPTAFNNWVKGSRPGLDGAFALCDAYGLSLDWIYFGDLSRLPYELALKLIGSPVPVAVATPVSQDGRPRRQRAKGGHG